MKEFGKAMIFIMSFIVVLVSEYMEIDYIASVIIMNVLRFHQLSNIYETSIFQF